MIDIDAIRNRAYYAANNRHRWASEVGVTDVDVLDGLRRAKQLAVEDVPALLAKVEELSAERDRLVEQVDSLATMFGDAQDRLTEARAELAQAKALLAIDMGGSPLDPTCPDCGDFCDGMHICHAEPGVDR